MSTDFDTQVRTARRTIEHHVASLPIAPATSIRERGERRRRRRSAQRIGVFVAAIAVCFVSAEVLPFDQLTTSDHQGDPSVAAGSSDGWPRSLTEDFHRARSVLLVNDKGRAQSIDASTVGVDSVIAIEDARDTGSASKVAMVDLRCLIQPAGVPEARGAYGVERQPARQSAPARQFAQAVLAYPTSQVADGAFRTVAATLETCIVDAELVGHAEAAATGPVAAITALSRPGLVVRGFESELLDGLSIRMVAVHVAGTSTISSFALLSFGSEPVDEAIGVDQIRLLVDRIAERSEQAR